MVRIGLISDTHGYIDDTICDVLSPCDQIWHAGDIGSVEVIDRLNSLEKLKGVFGNIDDQSVRDRFGEDFQTELNGWQFWMTHIAGPPNRYAPRIRRMLSEADPIPHVLIYGHSHILRVDYDKKHQNMIAINPGAAGHYGQQLVRTVMLMDVSESEIQLTVVELGPKGIRKPQIVRQVDIGKWKVPLRSKS
ncbi:MAG: metallophosphoesterase family protein [Planctomycetales bacterium]|nr:metallophosphoesterase family protein [Planctomycetales bacterium]